MTAALSFDVGDGAVWSKRNRFDAAAAQLADRHYSREVIGSLQVGGPGRVLVLVSLDERAVWISQVHIGDALPARSIADGFKGYRCAMFRNESDHLASTLIREAVRLTEELWGLSAYGWATYVDRSRVASTNPGYCFRCAGWVRDRTYDHPRLSRFLFNVEDVA